jgi:hypothetical protein
MKRADQIIEFLFNLKYPFKLPEGVGILDVHDDEEVRKACISFYKKFYNDNLKRRIMIGINPGRFGGGITGLPFTDPNRLENDCGIKNNWQKKQELSSVFMYEMMHAYGGVKQFYKDIYITAVSPLGFVKNGVNLNYYDDKNLKEQIKPFVIDSMNKQLELGIKTDVAFCIGEGENFKYLSALNTEFNWFNEIRPVPHPRFIMQYKLKLKQHYIDQYVKTLNLKP